MITPKRRRMTKARAWDEISSLLSTANHAIGIRAEPGRGFTSLAAVGEVKSHIDVSVPMRPIRTPVKGCPTGG